MKAGCVGALVGMWVGVSAGGGWLAQAGEPAGGVAVTAREEAQGGGAEAREGAPRWREGEKVMTVDRIEDDWVVLEVGEGQRVDIPLRVFPEGLGEGERLLFVRAKAQVEGEAEREAEERARALERLRRLRGEEVGQLGAKARQALGCR